MEKQQNNRVDEFFKKLMQDEHNQKCFDCDANSPQWASINNGVFVCMNCSGTHKSLGVQVSLVRSITLDIWTEKHMALMESGGNHKFNEYLDQYDLNTEDIKVKYNTKAAQYYRKYLASLANKQTFNDVLPEYNEGRKLADGKSNQSPSIHQQIADSVIQQQQDDQLVKPNSFEEQKNLDDGFSTDPQDTRKEEEEEWTFKVKNRASTIYEKVSHGAKDMFHKAKENETVDKVGTVASGTIKRAGTITKEAGVKVKGKLDEIGVTQVATETAQKVAFGTKLLGGYLWGKAKAASSAVNEKIDHNEKLANARDTTKQKVGAFAGFVSGEISSLYSKIASKDQPKRDNDEEHKEEEELVEAGNKENIGQQDNTLNRV